MIDFKLFLKEAKEKAKTEETEIKNDGPSELEKSEKAGDKEKEDRC